MADPVDDRRSGEDRRDEGKPSVWANPGLWVSILGLLLTIGILVGSVIAKQLSDLNAHLQAMELAESKTNTQHEDELHRLSDAMASVAGKLSTDETNQNAYNLHMNEKLTEIRVLLQNRGINIQP